MSFGPLVPACTALRSITSGVDSQPHGGLVANNAQLTSHSLPCTAMPTALPPALSSGTAPMMQVRDSGVLAGGIPPAHRVRGDHLPAPAPSSCPAGQRPVCGGGQAGQLHPHPARADAPLCQGRCAAPARAVPHCLDPHHGQTLCLPVADVWPCQQPSLLLASLPSCC